MIQLDDDITSYNFKEAPDKWKLRPATETEVEQGFKWCQDILVHGYPHGGLMDRMRAAQPSSSVHVMNTGQYQFLVYDALVLREEGVRFDRVRLAQDKDMTLQLLAPSLDVLGGEYDPPDAALWHFAHSPRTIGASGTHAFGAFQACAEAFRDAFRDPAWTVCWGYRERHK